MRLPRPSKRLLAMHALAIGLLLGACGGSEPSTTPSSGTGAAEPSTVSAQNAAAAQTNAAPSSATAGQPRRGQLDPCALLTQEQVNAAGNEPMLQGERSTGAPTLGQQICLWSAAAQGSSRMVLVSVVRTQDMDEALQKQKYSAGRLYRDSKAVEAQVEQVSGAGDEAIRVRNELRALKGGVYLTVQVGGGPIGSRGPDVTTDTLTTLAQTAFAKLGA